MNRDLNDMDGGRCAKDQGKGGWSGQKNQQWLSPHEVDVDKQNEWQEGW